MKRTIIIVLSVVVFLSVLAGAYLIFIKEDRRVAQKYDPLAETIKAEGTVSDYSLRSTDEILATHAGNSLEAYNDLISKAFLKQEVERYDEALTYYKAASDNAPSEELKNEADRLIYYMAIKSKNNALADEYKELLGPLLEQNITESAGTDGTR